MKLIIEIDKELKSAIYNCGLFLNPVDKTSLINAINNGIPLDDITAELTEWHNMKHSSLSDANYQIMLDIIDRHIGERSEE